MKTLARRSLALLLVTPAVANAQNGMLGLESDVRPFVERYCAACHGATDPEADLDLLARLGRPLDVETADVLRDVRDALRAHDMPPPGKPQPDAAARARIVAWADGVLASASASLAADPGRVTMRRLSRFEYANTVRDLLGVEVDPGAFPPDDLGYGFDNVGDALTLSPLHLERYAAVAERVAARALPDPDAEVPPVQRFDAERLACTLDDALRGDVVVMISNARATASVCVPRPGRYRVRVSAYATQAGAELARMDVLVDGRPVAAVEVGATAREPGDYAVEVELEDTKVQIGAAFVNDFWDPQNPDPGRRDRNLFVASISVQGPIDTRSSTYAERWLSPLIPASGRPAARARPMLAALLERAWRRPVTRAEVARLCRLVDAAYRDGAPFEESLRWAVQAALLSPHFLFRVEPITDRDGEVEELDGWAIATRLSYFLWSTLPDDRLRERAARGALGDADAVVAEARRMLAEPRADALATEFAGQWLELRGLTAATPDPDRFPAWNPTLAASARRETELLFLTVLREGLPARALVDADFTFVDARLAAHYGFPAPTGDGFVRTALDGRRTRGVLGHASFLTLTSNPTRTSPVKRGRWILDHLLDDPPPPPPPGSGRFAPGAPLDTPSSLRQQLALHRAQPACAACHDAMDPLGLALETFDPIGRPREVEAGVGDGAVLPDGRTVAGPAGLAALVARDVRFVPAVMHALFVYAVGRGLRPADAIALDAAVRALPPDPSLEDLVLAIVRLDAFRMRRS